MKEGSNIILRKAEVRDVERILSWENDTQNWLVSNTVTPFTSEQIQDFIENGMDIYESGQLRFVIEIQNEEIVGCVDLFDFDPKNGRVGIGVLVDEKHRGKGIAKEALRTTIEYCFDTLEVRCIHAEVLENNLASRSVFETCGFTVSGVKKEWLWDGQSYLNQVFYQRFK
ncbi:MAG: GNAT family protein [Flavobacteriales bacterium]